MGMSCRFCFASNGERARGFSAPPVSTDVSWYPLQAGVTMQAPGGWRGWLVAAAKPQSRRFPGALLRFAPATRRNPTPTEV